MLELNPGLTIWTIVTFLALLFLLRKFAWKPVLKALADRENSIRESLERAEHAKETAERILAENNKRLAQAEDDSQRILAEGRDAGERMKQEIAQKAHDEARAMVERAKAEIERAKRAAIQELRSEVATMAITVAEKILDQRLDPAQQAKIIEKEIAELSKTGLSNN